MRQREQPEFEFQPDERPGRGHVRSSVVAAHLSWVEYYGSPEDVGVVTAALRPLLSAPLADLPPREWIPFAALVTLDRAITRRFHETAPASELMEDVGRFTARALLSGRYRTWTDEDHHEFMAEMAVFEEEMFDFARYTYRRATAKSGLVIRIDASSFSRLHCMASIGFYEQCLILRGAVRSVVSEETCKCLGWPACKFRLRWK